MTNTTSSSIRCEEHLGTRAIVAAAYSVFAVSGTLANVLVIYLVCSFKKLKTTSNAFIVNGCVSDLLVCAFWMPQEAILVSTGRVENPTYRIFMEGVFFLWMTVSLLSHSLIALNRFVLITKLPTVYHTVYQKRNTEWMIAMAWVLPLAFLLPWLFGQRPLEVSIPCPQLRLYVFFGQGVPTTSSYTAILSAVTVLSQTAILLHCYFRIFRKVQVSLKRVSVLNFQVVHNLPCPCPRKDKRLGLYVLIVCCVFSITTEPFAWSALYGLFQPLPRGLETSSWLMLCLLFVLNPFIYTWKNEEFRRSFRAVVGGELWKSAAVSADPAVQTISQNEP
ncbi:probable G-protein coupled receptor 88 [Spea bombifrons]|uniref:probable G-protein coupled receptor 88 n=1 Tax=Spea bombifrons TaxID=233779 RepID=UPI00234A0F5D|nr:probable G-protein coupled receptor 88 [Spea bombifrons]